MISIFDFAREEEKKVYDALGLTDISKRYLLCEMAREKLSTTWPNYISRIKKVMEIRQRLREILGYNRILTNS